MRRLRAGEGEDDRAVHDVDNVVDRLWRAPDLIVPVGVDGNENVAVRDCYCMLAPELLDGHDRGGVVEQDRADILAGLVMDTELCGRYQDLQFRGLAVAQVQVAEGG